MQTANSAAPLKILHSVENSGA